MGNRHILCLFPRRKAGMSGVISVRNRIYVGIEGHKVRSRGKERGTPGTHPEIMHVVTASGTANKGAS